MEFRLHILVVALSSEPQTSFHVVKDNPSQKVHKFEHVCKLIYWDYNQSEAKKAIFQIGHTYFTLPERCCIPFIAIDLVWVNNMLE